MNLHGTELVLALLIAVATLVTIARRVGVAFPILLVLGGLVLGMVPGIPRVPIEPDQLRSVYEHRSEHVERHATPGEAEDREVLRHLERELDLEEQRMDA